MLALKNDCAQALPFGSARMDLLRGGIARDLKSNLTWFAARPLQQLYPFLGDRHEEEDIGVRDERIVARNH
jgi:hypothetical protein